MKKYAKIILLVILVVSLSSLFVACNKIDGLFEYKIEEDNTVTIKSYRDNSRVFEVVVPDEIAGLPVVKIDIVGLANSVYLKEITIGKNVKEINNIGIQNNEKLEKFMVAEGNQYFKAVDGILYTIDGKELVAYPPHKDIQTRPVLDDEGKPKIEFGSVVMEDFTPLVTIADGVEIIRPYAFYHAFAIENLVMSDSVKTIGEAAFLDCYRIQTIKFSRGLEKISKDSFTKIGSLKEITLFENMKEIESNSFYNCKNLMTVNFCGAEGSVKLAKQWYPTDQGKNIKSKIVWNYVAK
ncbi:MAG: leucine-rich repeat domain-containing protein [Clostridia bacterium]